MDYAQYTAALARREQVIRQNRSRRMRGLPALPVPSKPASPYYWEICESDGTYAGTVREDNERAADDAAKAAGLVGYILRRVPARS